MFVPSQEDVAHSEVKSCPCGRAVLQKQNKTQSGDTTGESSLPPDSISLSIYVNTFRDAFICRDLKLKTNSNQQNNSEMHLCPKPR